MGTAIVMKNEAWLSGASRRRAKPENKSLRSQFATANRNYVMLTSVYVPYTWRNASQISPTVA
jgi:hypothetical protein